MKTVISAGRMSGRTRSRDRRRRESGASATPSLKRATLAAVLLVGSMLGQQRPVLAAEVGSTAPGSEVPFSSDPARASEQRAVYDVVHRYEQLLNAGDTDGILALYAPDGVAEWNDKPTFATLDEKRTAYDALFKIARFSTVFGYAGIDVRGDTAVVRTFHHEGATVLEGGKKVVDLNREVFVLNKVDGVWKISLYIFNTDPVQGEG